MRSLTFLTDRTAIIGADTSVIINLNATGHASAILKALPNRVVVVDTVVGELEEGRRRGRDDAGLLDALVKDGVIDVVKLDAQGESYFEELVIGPAAMTLDDGEAATIAYSLMQAGIAVIDEKKATRICAERFPSLRLVSTVDVLADTEVQDSLGEDTVAIALFEALRKARMRVFPHHVPWVIKLIGAERASMCPSLPSQARLPSMRSSGLGFKKA